MAQEYGIDLPEGWNFAYWDVTYDSNSEDYGFLPFDSSIDLSGTYPNMTVMITNLSFQDLNKLEFVSAIVHEARHAWQVVKHENGTITLPPKQGGFSFNRRIVMEADAYMFQLTWMQEHGLQGGDYYNNVVNEWAKFYHEQAVSNGLLTGLGFCEPRCGY